MLHKRADIVAGKGVEGVRIDQPSPIGAIKTTRDRCDGNES